MIGILDPNFGLVYVYGEGGTRTIIENHMPGQVVIYNSSEPGSSGVLFDSESDSLNEIGINIGGETFIHDVQVKLRSFSSSYFSASLDNVPIKYDIGSVAYSFQQGARNNFDVVIKSEDEEFGTKSNVTCQYSGAGAWLTC